MATTSHRELAHLLVGVCRLHHTRANRAADEIGLYRGQAALLMTLWERDGMTHSEVADRLRISPAAATKVIKRMEQASYVERRGDPADDRLSRVFLLEQGRAVIARIHGAFEQLNGAMFDGMTDTELQCLGRLLARISANLRGAEPLAPEETHPCPMRSQP